LYKVNKIIDWRPIEEKLAGFTLYYGWGLIPFSEASTQQLFFSTFMIKRLPGTAKEYDF